MIESRGRSPGGGPKSGDKNGGRRVADPEALPIRERNRGATTSLKSEWSPYFVKTDAERGRREEEGWRKNAEQESRNTEQGKRREKQGRTMSEEGRGKKKKDVL